MSLATDKVFEDLCNHNIIMNCFKMQRGVSKIPSRQTNIYICIYLQSTETKILIRQKSFTLSLNEKQIKLTSKENLIPKLFFFLSCNFIRETHNLIHDAFKYFLCLFKLYLTIFKNPPNPQKFEI